MQKKLKSLQLTTDKRNYIVYNMFVRQSKALIERGGEMDEMTASQTLRLIEWLRSNGFTDKQIVECIEYISK